MQNKEEGLELLLFLLWELICERFLAPPLK